MKNTKGIFIISLDFELYWGLRGIKTIEYHKESLLRVRSVVPSLLKTFAEYDIHATWAVVGFLFFETRDKLVAALPAVKPNYANRKLSPYHHINDIGENEQVDPFHFAPSLIRMIQSSPDQEIGNHTFSHYYCLEDGQDVISFKNDLEAFEKAAKKYGVIPKSLIFPKGQINNAYKSVLREFGIKAYRANPSNLITYSTKNRLLNRAFRLIDAYINISGHNCYPVTQGTCEFPMEILASRPLRPYSHRFRILEPLRLRRILSELSYAANKGLVYHLWWHPHNFGAHPGENLSFLRKIFDHYASLRDRGKMESLNMGELSKILVTNKNHE